MAINIFVNSKQLTTVTTNGISLKELNDIIEETTVSSNYI